MPPLMPPALVELDEVELEELEGALPEEEELLLEDRE